MRYAASIRASFDPPNGHPAMINKLPQLPCLIAFSLLLMPTTGFAQRRTPEARDPHSPGFVEAKELPDGDVPPADAYGNFIIGPTHPKAPESSPQPGVPQGKVTTLTMKSEDSKIYPGIAREKGNSVESDPSDPAKPIVKSGPQPWTRQVAVYVPQQYEMGSEAPLIVGADGPDKLLFTVLDNRT